MDAYLRLFDRVLMLVYYRVPEKAMHQITGTSPALVNEHLELAKKHFPDPVIQETLRDSHLQFP